MEVDGVGICDDETSWRDETLREAKRPRRLASDVGKIQFVVRQLVYTKEYVQKLIDLRNAKDLAEEKRLRHTDIACHIDTWRLITWNEEEKDFQLSKPWDAISYPNDIGCFVGSATALRGSTLYSIGGMSGFSWFHNVHCHRWVHSLDMEKPQPSWNKLPDTKTPRVYHVAVCVGDCIYVFGTSDSYKRPPGQWGERFDIHKQRWEYLEAPPQLMFSDFITYPLSYAVYYNCPAFSYPIKGDDATHSVLADQNLVLFPTTGPPALFVFSCDSNKWLPTMKLDLPDHIFLGSFSTPYRPERFVVVGGVFIWHANGFIYAYDLVNQKFLGSLFTIPTHTPRNYSSRDPTLFISQQGEETLFLFFEGLPGRDIHSYKLRIQKQGQDFSLLEEKHTCLPTASNINARTILDVHPLREGSGLSKTTW